MRFGDQGGDNHNGWGAWDGVRVEIAGGRQMLGRFLCGRYATHDIHEGFYECFPC
jgi:hypothetical protein